jgi:hypothetical protein
VRLRVVPARQPPELSRPDQLHHDHDFDVIAAVTGQAVRWQGAD